MILTQPDYTKLVKAAYDKIKAGNTRPLLARPSRSDIREECLEIYSDRCNEKEEQPFRKDARALRRFFGAEVTSIQIIERSKAEKFRTLNNYLNEKSGNTDEINIELLAWLIDFPHRPWVLNMDVELSEEEKGIINKKRDPSGTEHKVTQSATSEKSAEITEAAHIEATLEKEDNPADVKQDQPGKEKLGIRNKVVVSPIVNIKFGSGFDQAGGNRGTTQNPPNPPTTGPNKKPYIAAIVFLILVILSGTLYAIINRSEMSCVYWVIDHYEETSCDDETPGRKIRHLKEIEWKNFRMITLPDTITERSIEEIYYIKDGSIKCYNQPGDFPEEPHRKLKKMTRLIYEKYIAAKRDSAKTALAEK